MNKKWFLDPNPIHNKTTMNAQNWVLMVCYALKRPSIDFKKTKSQKS